MAAMKAKEHPEYPRLELAMIVAAHAREWEGVIYRSAPPKWSAGRDLLTGAGSMKAGARFNAQGSFAMVYGSTTPELAMIESLAFQRAAVCRCSTRCRWSSRQFQSKWSGCSIRPTQPCWQL